MFCFPLAFVMSQLRLSSNMGGLYLPHPKQIPAMLVALYNRAPASVATFSSLLVSYLANLAYLDWTRYKALGTGGVGKPNVLKWLAHALVLRPLSMSSSAARDADYLPPDDIEWKRRIESSGRQDRLRSLPHRGDKRPLSFGFVPHRQVESIEKEGSDFQKAIISHLVKLADFYPTSLVLSLSSYEDATSPSLFVRHIDEPKNDSGVKPTHLARLYLSGNPPPRKTMQGAKLTNIDNTYHELAHIHLSEGSVHVTLSPQDARQVVLQGWGELHRLAGLLYRGHYVPPYWLPTWVFTIFGGQSRARWSYLQRKSSTSKGKLIPPTYCMLYAANSSEQVEWVKAIIDSSVAWSIGQPL